MKKTIRIYDIDCPNCAHAVEVKINALKRVNEAKIDFMKSELTLDSDDMENAIIDVVNLVKIIEPNARVVDEENVSVVAKKSSGLIGFLLLGFGILIGVLALVIPVPTWLYWIMLIGSVVAIGYKTYYKAFQLLIKGVVNENLLVTISVIGAIAVGEHMEGVMVVALYTIGKILESLALNKSRKSIEALTNLRPERVTKVIDDCEIVCTPEGVMVDDIILVRPGERIALDGVVIEGKASLDTQSLTGESVPRMVDVDDEVLSGCIVLDAVLKIKVTKPYVDSTVSQILDMMEHATSKKSKTETAISSMSRWYTLAVIALAVVVFGVVFAISHVFTTALYRGLIFLVVSCPCAFAISVPLAYFSGLGNASSKGILIKGSNFIDNATKLDVVAFDKTGTITTGEFEITDIKSCVDRYTADDILYLAGLGEQYSLHPLAVSIVRANTKKLVKVNSAREISGEGVFFEYDHKPYFVGRKEASTDTAVDVYENNEKIGRITLADTIKPSAKQAVADLHKMGIKTVMLSGDNAEVVKRVGAEVGMDEVVGEMLPGDKFAYIEKLKNENPKLMVGYAGDGINDAPTLALSDVGFGMGVRGNSASIEASDIVIANDNPQKIVEAISISKYTRSIVWQNIIFAGVVKVLFLTFGAVGVTGMLSAVIADVGVTIVAILNSLRALKHGGKKKPKHGKN